MTKTLSTADRIEHLSDVTWDASKADLITMRNYLEHALILRVWQDRADGCSWAQIALDLGVSRQAAHERWSHLDDLEWEQLPVFSY
jgi:hypothetical protein